MKAVELATLIPKCCSEVLEAMYFTAVLGAVSAAAAPEPAPDAEDELAAIPAPDLAFSLHFAGDVSGRFGLRLHPDTARTLASNFLGEDPSALSPTEVSEVIGELTNMLCGSVMSRVEGEHKFILSHPEPTSFPPCAADGSCDTLTSTLDTDSGELLVRVTIEAAA
ncbi:MAG: chemotaxis protein CheX [Acidobacteriaceae bacterium]|jgi:CheY-specific phosphatase CheX